MNIENDLKLDYSGVLLRPKRSTLSSRKEVTLSRKHKFRNYTPDFPDNIEDYHYNGIPIMAANMDGVGTFEMANTLSELDLFTCLVKTYSVEELIKF
jgi:GMP reductase